jgi:hypothetical protein
MLGSKTNPILFKDKSPKSVGGLITVIKKMDLKKTGLVFFVVLQIGFAFTK